MSFDQSLLDKYSPYLSEILSKLRLVVIVFVVGGVLGFIYYQNILTGLMGFFKLEGINLVLTSPYQFIDLAVQTGLVTGTALVFPLFFYQSLGFIKPALKHTEYSLVVKLLPLAMILFVIGFCFGVWVLQFVIAIFHDTSSQLAVDNIWDISGFFSQILLTGISLAGVFQLPIVITLLIRLNILSHAQISKKRRIIYAIIVVIAALLPPTDIISLSLLAIVPLFLFESALLLNRSKSNNQSSN